MPAARCFAALLRVRVRDDVGPRDRQPAPEVDPHPPSGLGIGHRSRSGRWRRRDVEVHGAAPLKLLFHGPRSGSPHAPGVALAERLKMPHRDVSRRCDGQPVARVRQRQHGRKPLRAVLRRPPRGTALRAVRQTVVVLLTAPGADVEPAVQPRVVQIRERADESGPRARGPRRDRSSGRQRVRHVALPGRRDVDGLPSALLLPLVRALSTRVVPRPHPEHAGLTTISQRGPSDISAAWPTAPAVMCGIRSAACCTNCGLGNAGCQSGAGSAVRAFLSSGRTVMAHWTSPARAAPTGPRRPRAGPTLGPATAPPPARGARPCSGRRVRRALAVAARATAVPGAFCPPFTGRPRRGRSEDQRPV